MIHMYNLNNYKNYVRRVINNCITSYLEIATVGGAAMILNGVKVAADTS